MDREGWGGCRFVVSKRHRGRGRGCETTLPETPTSHPSVTFYSFFLSFSFSSYLVCLFIICMRGYSVPPRAQDHESPPPVRSSFLPPLHPPPPPPTTTTVDPNVAPPSPPHETLFDLHDLDLDATATATATGVGDGTTSCGHNGDDEIKKEKGLPKSKSSLSLSSLSSLSRPSVPNVSSSSVSVYERLWSWMGERGPPLGSVVDVGRKKKGGGGGGDVLQAPKEEEEKKKKEKKKKRGSKGLESKNERAKRPVVGTLWTVMRSQVR